MRKVNVGVIGVGAMGRHHARVYSELPTANLVGVVDLNIYRAREIAQMYNTTAYDDVEKLLMQDLDAVSIAVPTSMHMDVALKVAEYGIDMLIEKPIAESIKSAKKIIKAAKNSGSKVMVGHIERFNPAIVKLKQIVNSGQIGELFSISCRRMGPYPDRIKDVGIIIDLAVHEIDTISYIYGLRADSVYAAAGSTFQALENFASIVLRFFPERVGSIDTNWLSPIKVRELCAFGSRGMAKVNYIEQSLEILHPTGKMHVEVRKREPLKNEIESFLNAVIADEDPIPSGEDGLYVLSVAISAIESYKRGIPIQIPV